MKSPKPKATFQEQLENAQKDYETWMQVATKPGMSPDATTWALGAAKSALAEVNLLQRAVPVKENLNLTRLLQLPPEPTPEEQGAGSLTPKATSPSAT